MQPLQNLLSQYTDRIQVDPRVFSQEVMGQDQFYQPFKAWTNNFVQQYMRPEFERYQLNPYNQQATQELYGLNQLQGASGGWRTNQARTDYNNQANQFQLGREDLLRKYSDNVMNVYDTMRSQWADPLYKSRFQKFYEAPWRNINTGQTQATTQPSLPATRSFNNLLGKYQI